MEHRHHHHYGDDPRDGYDPPRGHLTQGQGIGSGNPSVAHLHVVGGALPRPTQVFNEGWGWLPRSQGNDEEDGCLHPAQGYSDGIRVGGCVYYPEQGYYDGIGVGGWGNPPEQGYYNGRGVGGWGYPPQQVYNSSGQNSRCTMGRKHPPEQVYYSSVQNSRNRQFVGHEMIGGNSNGTMGRKHPPQQVYNSSGQNSGWLHPPTV